ncbi:hypothetical protein BSFA1_79280 (plasmid) [Burkholderia sp. SFA1]|uniref:RNA chaperone Hfq n=1 Tax=Caballeronia novacaledonica TaxID=1544861 RepID=A0ACB5R396_9BURK|nr:hypothetical protein BSFA1_79280 [Burkholderia sp. SFA1]GJH21861.1 RNA chaperone Hfq [Caballeronia novacaledonica]
MPDTVPKPKHDFLNALRKEQKRVSVFLVNGIKLTGNIESFDSYTVQLHETTGSQVIYKHSISTVSEDHGRPQTSAREGRTEHPDRRARPGRRVP